MTATLATCINATTKERDWFVTTDHADAHVLGDQLAGEVCGYWPQQGGDASLKACETWLKTRGFVRRGDLPPDVFEYYRP